jgi:glycosyltransferase involved in cell wall biosynthesis
MRIALVTSCVPFGGTTTFSLFLLGSMRKRGIEVGLFSFESDHPMEREFSDAGVSVHLENKRSKIFEERLSSIYEQLKRFNPSAVFAVLGPESFELLRYLPKSVLRVGMLHDHTDDVYRLVENYASSFDQLVVVSAHIYNHVRQHFPKVPVHYLQPADGPLRIIFFGRLQESQKRVRIFPKIYQGLKDAGVEFHWRIHGTGPEEQFLHKELSRGVACGDVSFSRPVQHEGLTEIIGQNDVYLLTSAHEAGPLTLLEGMAHGLVPVCGDIPCLVSEVITSDMGIRVPFENANAYVQGLAELASNRGRLEEMSRKAKQKIDESFSADAMAGRYVAFLENHTPVDSLAPWPDRIMPDAILGVSNPFWYSRTGRLLRRIKKWMKFV